MKDLLRLLSWGVAILFTACGEIDVESLTIQTLTISPKSATIKIGETIQINANSTPAYDNNIFSWSSTNNTVATVDGN